MDARKSRCVNVDNRVQGHVAFARICVKGTLIHCSNSHNKINHFFLTLFFAKIVTSRVADFHEPESNAAVTTTPSLTSKPFIYLILKPNNVFLNTWRHRQASEIVRPATVT